MHPVHLIADLLKTALDDASLNDDRGDGDQGGLGKEGADEGSAAEGAVMATEAWEGVATEEEEKDGAEGFGPAVGPGGSVVVGRSEAEEHGVAYLDCWMVEGEDRGVNLPVCMETKVR